MLELQFAVYASLEHLFWRAQHVWIKAQVIGLRFLMVIEFIID